MSSMATFPHVLLCTSFAFKYTSVPPYPDRLMVSSNMTSVFCPFVACPMIALSLALYT